MCGFGSGDGVGAAGGTDGPRVLQRTLKAFGGVNAHLTVPALVAGVVVGADSIDDMDLLRRGGMGRLFTGIRARPRWAPSFVPSRSAPSASWTRSPHGS